MPELAAISDDTQRPLLLTRPASRGSRSAQCRWWPLLDLHAQRPVDARVLDRERGGVGLVQLDVLGAIAATRCRAQTPGIAAPRETRLYA